MPGCDRDSAADHARMRAAFGFVGTSGAGKTTLMAGVAAALCAGGYAVSAIRCTPAEDDAFRRNKEACVLRNAGCRDVIWPEEKTPVSVRGGVRDPAQRLERMLGRTEQVDIVLVEACEDLPLPALGVFRPAPGEPLVVPGGRCLVALATDADVRYGGITLDLNAPQTVADFIVTYLDLRDARRRPASGSKRD